MKALKTFIFPLFLLAPSLPVAAAPVTLAFEAEVSAVDVHFPLDIPFFLQVGDRIHGQFEFEQFNALPSEGFTQTDSVQTLGLSLSVDSLILKTSEYFLRSRNNSGADDGPGSHDHLFLSCSSSGFVECQPETVPGADHLVWFFSLPLLGDHSVLDGADIPGDVAAWNQMIPGYLSLTLQDPGIADVLRINARIERFSVVPEPSTLFLALTFISVICVRFLQVCR